MPKQGTAYAYGKRKRKNQHENLKKKLSTSDTVTLTPTDGPIPQSELSAFTETSLCDLSHTKFQAASQTPINSQAVFESVRDKKSASEKKLSRWNHGANNVTAETSDVFASFKISALNRFVSQMLCPECVMSGMTVQSLPKLKLGLYCKYVAVCDSCGHSMNLETESQPESESISSLSKLTVLACKETGITCEQLIRFHGITNHTSMNRDRFFSLAQSLHSDCQEALKSHLKAVNEHVRDAHSDLLNRKVERDEVLDIDVSFDGTWQKRGRTSHHGVGVVIDVETGYVIDFEVLSNWCIECEKNVMADKEWKRKHEESGKCEKNFDGNSGAMEKESALRMWRRSVSLHRFRYVVMVSDGDSSAYAAVKEGVYDVRVEKEECINHVGKRLYNRLANMKDKYQGAERIHGQGRISDSLMRDMQRHYGQAIKDHAKNVLNGSSIEKLSERIMGILYHEMSCDGNPLHNFCPTDSKTFCKYNQIALGLLNESDLPPRPKPKLPVSVGMKVKPVFEALRHPDILKRCVRALTQNANESFNNMIWLRCPKNLWSSASSVFIGTVLACLKFNKGAAAVFDVLPGVQLSENQLARAEALNRKRLYCGGVAAQKKKLARRYAKKAATRIVKDDNNAYSSGAH